MRHGLQQLQLHAKEGTASMLPDKNAVYTTAGRAAECKQTPDVVSFFT